MNTRIRKRDDEIKTKTDIKELKKSSSTSRRKGTKGRGEDESDRSVWGKNYRKQVFPSSVSKSAVFRWNGKIIIKEFRGQLNDDEEEEGGDGETNCIIRYPSLSVQMTSDPGRGEKRRKTRAPRVRRVEAESRKGLDEEGRE